MFEDILSLAEPRFVGNTTNLRQIILWLIHNFGVLSAWPTIIATLYLC